MNGATPFNRGEMTGHMKRSGSFGPPPDVICPKLQNRVRRRPTMTPQTQFCHNLPCPARGQRGQGKIRVHSQVEQRYRCMTGGPTFVATTGTPFYRLRTATDVVTLVLTLWCHGCPLQAIVAAFGWDERTVAAWPVRAGQHCQQVHQHVVQQGRVDVRHGQGDSLLCKLGVVRVWTPVAHAVPSRLWLGGVIGSQHDLLPITCLGWKVRRYALPLGLSEYGDVLVSYVTA